MIEKQHAIRELEEATKAYCAAREYLYTTGRSANFVLASVRLHVARGANLPRRFIRESKRQEKLPRSCHLRCCCCGGEAIGRQWYNRDKGFGICSRCVAWVASSGTSAREIRAHYGVAGVHYNVKAA